MRVVLVLLGLLCCQCFRHPVRLAFDRQRLQRTNAFGPAERVFQRGYLDRLVIPNNSSTFNTSVIATPNHLEVESDRSLKAVLSKINEWWSPIGSAAASGLRTYFRRQAPEEPPASLTKKIIEEYVELQQSAQREKEASESGEESEEQRHLSLGQRIGQLVGWHKDDSESTHSSSAAALQEQLYKLATSAAVAINSTVDARDFASAIGFDVLIDQLKNPSSPKLDILQALQNAVKHLPEYGVDLVQSRPLLEALCEWMEAPSKGLFPFRPKAEQEAALELQREAVQFVQRLVRNNGITVDLLKTNGRLIAALNQLAQLQDADEAAASYGGAASEHHQKLLQRQLKASGSAAKRKPNTLLIGRTVVSDYANLTTPQMARVTSWGIGGVPWRPRQPHQKGLRILSFDGGGTKGVLSAAMLSELWAQLGYDQSTTRPCDVFDIICGTSTGGILAALYGLQQQSLSATEQLYESFVDQIFAGRSSLNLLSSKAYYREEDFERILHDFCGEQLLVDSNQQPQVPRVFCVSTKVNDGSDAGKAHLWRNYNYPPGVQPKYSGSCFANTYTAIRATTAAPTFFTPVTWKDGVYIDGAMVANNPTAIAVQEAKMLYPGVPIELVVSIGTGRFSDRDTSRLTISWSRLLSQIVASSTDTEDVHTMLTHFLPSNSYYRFNPSLRRHYTIDTKDKATLQELKQVGRDYITNYVTHGGGFGESSDRFQSLLKTLRGNSYRG